MFARWMTIGFLSLVTVASLTLGFAAPAQAVQTVVLPYVPPGGASALNVLPSVVSAGGKVAATAPEAFLISMGRFLKSPEVIAAYRASQAGAATAAQTTLVVAEKAAFTVPATVPGAVVKVSTAGNVAVGGFMIGTMIGATASRILGFKDSQVCEQRNGLLTVASTILNGVDCGAWENKIAQAAKNSDQVGTSTGGPSCGSTYCASLLQSVRIPAGSGTGYINIFRVTPLVRASLTIVIATDTYGTGTDACDGAGGYAAITCASYGPGLSRHVSSIPMSSYWVSDGTGSPVHVVVQTVRANPPRTTKAIVTMTDGTVIAGTSSDQFTENDPAFKMSPLPIIPDGKIPSSVKIVESTPGQPDADLSVQPTTPEYQKFRTDYPECQDGSCILDLVKRGTGTCLALGTECADWYTDPLKADKYDCTFGGKPVALTECTAYAPKFKPGNQEQGKTLGDPVTGQEVAVKTTQGVSTDLGTPVVNPEGPRECFPTGWAAFNPINWVLQPVGCALQSAFVPRASVLKSRMDALNSSWSRTQPAKIALSVAAIGPALGTLQDGGCSGVTVNLSGIAPGIIPPTTGKFLAACQGDFFYPWANGVKLFLIGGLTIGGFFAIKKQIGQMVGMSGAA